jgi:hypothetical protein
VLNQADMTDPILRNEPLRPTDAAGTVRIGCGQRGPIGCVDYGFKVPSTPTSGYLKMLQTVDTDIKSN